MKIEKTQTYLDSKVSNIVKWYNSDIYHKSYSVNLASSLKGEGILHVPSIKSTILAHDLYNLDIKTNLKYLMTTPMYRFVTNFHHWLYLYNITAIECENALISENEDEMANCTYRISNAFLYHFNIPFLYTLKDLCEPEKRQINISDVITVLKHLDLIDKHVLKAFIYMNDYPDSALKHKKIPNIQHYRDIIKSKNVDHIIYSIAEISNYIFSMNNDYIG